jgi:uncharacterized protein YjdB
MRILEPRSGFLACLGIIMVLAACDNTDPAERAAGADLDVQFTLAPGELKLWPGDTARISAPLTGGNGKQLNPRSLRWVSTSTASATVNADGLVTGVAPGRALIVASSGKNSDTTQVTVVEGTRLIISPAAPVLNWIGAAARMTAALKDADGRTTGTAVRWKSLDPGVIQIDSMGNVKARAVGSALIVATAVCCGQADTTQARVQQVAASVEVQPGSATMQAGATLQLLGAVRDSGSVLVSGATLTWRSDDDRIAAVSATGQITAVSPGTVAVRGTSGTQSGVTQLTVAPAASSAAGEIPLALHRLDGRSGIVRVSNGILLAPGQLRPEQVGSVSVSVGGAEVSAYVEPLDGRHRDGSVVSVLIQFDADPAVQRNAALRIGTPPARTRLAKRTIDFRPGATLSNVSQSGFPAAVAVPPVQHMVAAFQLFGPTVSVADARAMGGAFRTFEDDFAYWGGAKCDDFQAYLDAGAARDRIMGSNYYDRGYHTMAWFARSGDVKWLRCGAMYTFAYRFHYYEHNNYAISQERLWLSEGLALHYWLTGDPESRNAVLRLADHAWGGGSSWNVTRLRQCNYKGEARPVARALSAMTWAYRLGAEEYLHATRNYTDLIAKGGTEGNQWGTDPADHRFGAWLYRHPDFPTGAGCSVEYVSNFMNAMILDALITVYDHVHADSRIPGIVGRNLDYLRKTQWRGVEGNGLQLANGEPSPSFNYYDVSLVGSGGPSATVDLNGFYVHVFAWYARNFGGAHYANIAEQTFVTLSKNPKDGRSGPWLRVRGSDKQMNETYQKAWQYPALAR